MESVRDLGRVHNSQLPIMSKQRPLGLRVVRPNNDMNNANKQPVADTRYCSIRRHAVLLLLLADAFRYSHLYVDGKLGVLNQSYPHALLPADTTETCTHQQGEEEEEKQKQERGLGSHEVA